MADIVLHTPYWVWAVLAYLVFVGVRGLRPTVRRIAILPLVPSGFLAWSAWTYLVGARSAGAAGVWVVAILAGAGLGWRWMRTVVPAPGPSAGTILLPGTPVTLVVMMVIFLCNYAVGVISAVAPAHLGDPSIRFGLPLVAGFCCGLFNGRAWQLWRTARA